MLLNGHETSDFRIGRFYCNGVCVAKNATFAPQKRLQQPITQLYTYVPSYISGAPPGISFKLGAVIQERDTPFEPP